VARDLGVDISAVAGTGPGGRITEGDVRTAVGPAGTETSGLRAVIARNMLRSSTETAAVTLHSTVDLGEAAPSHIVGRGRDPAAHPLNGQREGGIFVPADVTHVAVAIQTDDGLIAPVVRDTAPVGGRHLRAIRDLAARATAAILTTEDFAGGTFTVTNLGAYGVDGFTPIINLPGGHPGVGAVRLVPGLDKGAGSPPGIRWCCR
jgi:pyruvate dehydrogenase E2 component (dihydrolipoamide acetyltransferase)